ncbi:hypothetical protein [Fusobacterium polymorphum]|uniref:hypothetical protein n=1 Tax=Fusobacterium nucleatum subsp. polymorphum TaxID=76857 RepID=UPI001179FACA|nr:hypothetical protein [Fusobacterium polymorphum]
MISLSLSNFIKNILNIQDDNISFPEEDYCHIIQKANYVIKVFNLLFFLEKYLSNLLYFI